MKIILSSRYLLITLILILASMACSFPTKPDDTTASPTSETLLQNPPQTSTAAHLPTLALPRPTHQQNQTAFPKPTLPVPPSQTTRESQSQVITQPTSSSQSNPTGTSGDFYVTNLSTAVICYFFMALSTDSQWGSDYLGNQGLINPGETFTISNMPFGAYDAQALDCDGNILGEVYGFEFPPSDMFSLTD